MSYSMNSPEVKEIISALHKAQGEMRGAVKDKDNPFHKSKYADLSSVWEACREPLQNNGLSITQTMAYQKVGEEAAIAMLVTTLWHISGQWMSSYCPIKPVKPNDPQGFGAAITYVRRFSLSSILCICAEDDDAEKERKELERKNALEYERKKMGVMPTDTEIKELESVLMQCPREYRAKMLDARFSRGWFSFGEMPLNAFNALKDDALKALKLQKPGIITLTSNGNGDKMTIGNGPPMHSKEEEKDEP